MWFEYMVRGGSPDGINATPSRAALYRLMALAKLRIWKSDDGGFNPRGCGALGIAPRQLQMLGLWWPGRELNPRRLPFQSWLMLWFKQLK